MATNDQVIETARRYVGVPFIHQGRTDRGLDCIGLIVRVAHDLELSAADFRRYGREPDGRTFQDELKKHLDRRLDGQFDGGDILSFALPGYPCHVGIYTNDGTIIHALSRRGKVVEHKLSQDWRRKIRGVYRYKGIV